MHLEGLSFSILYKSSLLKIECLLQDTVVSTGASTEPSPTLTFISLVNEVKQSFGL